MWSGSSELRFEGDVDSLMVHGPYMWEPIGFQNSSQLPTLGVKFSREAYQRMVDNIMNSTHARDSENLFGNRAALSHQHDIIRIRAIQPRSEQQ